MRTDVEEFAKNVEELAYILGDADNDKLVTVNDYTTVRNLILTATRYEEINEAGRYAADANGDGVIDVADLTGISNILFDKDFRATARAMRGAQATAESEISIVTESEETGVFGKTVRMAVNLNNSVAFTAGQMDITMPHGMRIAEVGMSERADGHEVVFAELGNGTYRIVVSALENKEFAGNNGVVFYIDVEVESGFNGGEVTADNIIFSDARANGYRLGLNTDESTGIDGIEAATVKERIYSVGGQMMNAVKKGINIIVGEDGKARKILNNK